LFNITRVEILATALLIIIEKLNDALQWYRTEKKSLFQIEIFAETRKNPLSRKALILEKRIQILSSW
jgi:hypothetical protein